MIRRLLFVLLVWLFSARVTAGDTLRVYRDCSMSMDEAGLRTLLPAIVQVLREHPVIDIVEVVRFSCHGERLQTVMATVYRLDPKPKELEARTDGLAGFFRAGADAQLREVSAKATTEVNSWRNRRDQTLKQVATDLVGEPKQAAACTRFDQLALRIAEEDIPYTLVLTDGWVDCQQAAPKLPAAHHQPLIVLLPRDKDPVNDAVALFDARQKQMRELFARGAEIVQPYLAPKALARLLK